MRLKAIHTGNFKLDGGAMFGVVPKSIWNKKNPADENNMCNWAMRCLLIEDGDRLILIDNGIGDKQSEKFFSYYYLNGDNSLKQSLHKAGVDFSDITDVFLTHLHFDHCGGSVKWNADRTGFSTVFPNAIYWTHEEHWNTATIAPNAREKASFIKENLFPIQESGQLKFLDSKHPQLTDNINCLLSYGHTDAMMIPKISYKDKTIVFMADLMPSIHHMPINYVMGYDIRPLDAMSEKDTFLKEALANDYILYFEHDPVNECCTVEQTEKGIRPSELFTLEEATH